MDGAFCFHGDADGSLRERVLDYDEGEGANIEKCSEKSASKDVWEGPSEMTGNDDSENSLTIVKIRLPALTKTVTTKMCWRAGFTGSGA